MSTKHTPGPWVPGFYNATETFKQRIAEEQQCAIVQDDGPLRSEGMLIAICGDFNDEQSRADARLMAASPTMLSYVQKVSAWVFVGQFLHKGMTYKKGVNDTTALKVLECLYLEIVEAIGENASTKATAQEGQVTNA